MTTIFDPVHYVGRLLYTLVQSCLPDQPLAEDDIEIFFLKSDNFIY